MLASEEVFTGFSLKSLRDYSYESLLDSYLPEEVKGKRFRRV